MAARWVMKPVLRGLLLVLSRDPLVRCRGLGGDSLASMVYSAASRRAAGVSQAPLQLG
jgi:hypothetical protein